MPHWEMGWRTAAATSVGLGLIVLLVRPRGRGRRPVAAAREVGIVLALFALWQVAGRLSTHDYAGADGRSRGILSVERWMHLPSEHDLQHLILGHPVLVQLCNGFYIYGHFNALIIFLAWVWLRHPGAYPRVRAVLVLTTALCLLVQTVPFAPPRLLSGTGFVDTAALYDQSVYTADGMLIDSLAAMPSVHVAWALLVGFAPLWITRSRWRYLALAHPVVTVFVVVATGNHFWLDGIVAAAILGLSVGLVTGLAAVRSRRSPAVTEPG